MGFGTLMGDGVHTEYQHRDEGHLIWEALVGELGQGRMDFFEAGNRDTFHFSHSVGNCHH